MTRTECPGVALTTRGVLTTSVEGGEMDHDTRAAQFWAKVDRSGGPDACWPWLGRLYGGYGSFGGVGAHRVAYELLRGAIPEGRHVDHRCHTDDPTCQGGPS